MSAKMHDVQMTQREVEVARTALVELDRSSKRPGGPKVSGPERASIARLRAKLEKALGFLAVLTCATLLSACPEPDPQPANGSGAEGSGSDSLLVAQAP